MLPAFAMTVVIMSVMTLSILAFRYGRKLTRRPGKLKPFYLRLCQTSPSMPCPCAKGGGRYEQCCRPADLADLEQEVKAFLWTHWQRRSGGRRNLASMRHRMEDHPLPEATLPEWVTNPDGFQFPIAEEEVRAWSPMPKKGADGQEPGGIELGGDLPI